MKLLKEEMNIYGYSVTDIHLPSKDLAWFRKDLIARKQQEVDELGEDYLKAVGNYDILRNVIRDDEEGRYSQLVEANWLNDIVDELLGEKAIIHDYFAMFNTSEDKNLTRNKFHRDFPSMESRRVSIHVIIPLLNVDGLNGATEIVPGTHTRDDFPSDEFCKKHKVSLDGNAGQVFVMDSATIHRAGPSKTFRPVLILRYQLPFIKQPINLCKVYQSANFSEFVRQRLGWQSQGLDHVNDDSSKWQSGQYNLKSTNRYE